MTLRREEIELINKLAGQNQQQDSMLFQKILEISAQWSLGREDQDLSQVFTKITGGSPIKIAKSRLVEWMAVASFSLLALFTTWLIGVKQNVQIDVPLAEIRTTWLPDSSMVVLNANASLSYSIKDWEAGHRSVSLGGVGYFEVQKGSKFQVETLHGLVTVLGTSFNVKALEEDFIVECLTGSVAVNGLEEDHSILLRPGYKSFLDRSTKLLIPTSFDTTSSKEWLNGIFNFNNQSISSIWDEFERQFAVQVVYDDTTPRYYTGTFNNKDMQKALVAICKPMGMTYEIDSEKNIITITK